MYHSGKSIHTKPKIYEEIIQYSALVTNYERKKAFLSIFSIITDLISNSFSVNRSILSDNRAHAMYTQSTGRRGKGEKKGIKLVGENEK